MGLFSSFKSNSGQMTSQRAFVCSLVYMIAADGVVEDEEIAQLQGALAQFADSRELLDWAVKYFNRHSQDDFLRDATPILSDSQKMTILVNLADSLTSDGDADPSEQNLFFKFLDAFGVDERRFEPFFTVIAIKNDRTVFLNDHDPKNAPTYRVSLEK